MTVCDPDKPTWKFHAPEATVDMQHSVHLENGNFRLFSVPVLYLPYATFPAEKHRASGFLIPDIGDSSSKGFILGDAFYWAPTDWMDMTVGANYYSRRGWSQRADLRMRPWENARLDTNYTGVVDRGLATPTGPRQAGRPRGLNSISPLCCRMDGGRWPSSTTIVAHLPHGVQRNIRAGDELGSAQYRLPDREFERLQPEFRGIVVQELCQRDSGDFGEPAHRAGSAVWLGGSGPVAKTAACIFPSTLSWMRRTAAIR